jgi:hypothetical protein
VSDGAWPAHNALKRELRSHVLAQQVVEAGKQVLDVWAILAAG